MKVQNQVILLIAILFFTLPITSPFAQIVSSVDNKKICEKNKGVWRSYGNSCGDSCESAINNNAICGSEDIYACECGKNRCWDQDSCITIRSYEKRIAEIKTEEENNSKKKEEQIVKNLTPAQTLVSKENTSPTQTLVSKENTSPTQTPNSKYNIVGITDNINPHSLAGLMANATISKLTGNKQQENSNTNIESKDKSNSDEYRKQSCEMLGGIWKEFSNGCAGNCESQLSKGLMCAAVLTYGCDCGENRCWDNNICVTLSQYKSSHQVEDNQQVIKATDDVKLNNNQLNKGSRQLKLD